MESYYLTCRSLTYAQRVSQALTGAGIRNMITRVSPTMSREGCGYAVRISTALLSRAMGVLASAALPPKRVFRVMVGGGFEEVRV